ncbi:MAG: arginine--tRNA ligase [Ignavibacteria bacterium RIFCSPLOWO2_02_FULL_55_14]|nr:MAG: arginine--tRNA ligase [Ignavibacteria bacterium RIFCSPLOWO2_02_FULL_55_14]OGU75913.1 MAG: arginine--tRNA ligase [Ignavibacteria bacterium RIFCSPLOWO2_12_FULL_56_21]
MKRYLEERVGAALERLGYAGMAELAFEAPKQEAHGDLTTNIALLLAKAAGKNPRVVAKEIVDSLDMNPASVTKTEVAGPGFINFTFSPAFFARKLEGILREGASYGRSTVGRGVKAMVEYVSANPTGPLSVGHGRQAAIGDTLANVLQWTGHEVTREYYYNNAGRQMRVLAQSTYARYRQLFDPASAFPEDGYQGEYIQQIALLLKSELGDSLVGIEEEKALAVCKERAEQVLFDAIKSVLLRMGIRHDVFYNEDSLYSSKKINEVVDEFRSKGLAYDKDGAVWFKATDLGLDQDRVIIKSTGEPTYRLPDIAYHREKFLRGFELVVDVFGADHIATIPDVLAGIKALGFDPDKVKVVIHQFVTLMRNGEQVKMSKRLANFVTLDELIDEVGSDAVRYFFLMRSNGTHLEFDLSLATEHSDKNPVYYVQYAHARIASMLRFAMSEGAIDPATDPSAVVYDVLQSPAEIALMKQILQFPELVEGTAKSLEPHRVPTYLHELATAFHRFYHDHRVVVPEKDISTARLALCACTKTVLANGLAILGVSAPDRM